jgi:hypothetical protein
MNMFRATFSHKAGHLFAMNRRAIPDDQQFLVDLKPQVLEEADAICALERTLSHQRVKLSAHRDPAHHRQMIIGQKRLEHGRLPTRSISADPTGQEVEPCFVNTDNNQALFECLFFKTGQPSMRHSEIASSSRWLARSMGSCGVQQRTFNRREICALWYWTPNSS